MVEMKPHLQYCVGIFLILFTRQLKRYPIVRIDSPLQTNKEKRE